MKRYCRFMADGITVNDVLDFPDDADPKDVLSTELYPLYIPCPSNVEGNWTYIDGEWLEPVAPPEPPVPPHVYATVTPAEFESLFTIDEVIGIEDSTNRKVGLYWKRYTDRTLAKIDMNLQSVQDFIDLLITEGIVAAERREDILDGVAQ